MLDDLIIGLAGGTVGCIILGFVYYEIKIWWQGRKVGKR